MTWHLRVYLDLMSKRAGFEPETGERHHIIPRFAGGEDVEENLVKLTLREHFIAHKLLVRIYKNTPFECSAKLAVRFLTISRNGVVKNSRDFENARKYLIEANRGRLVSFETRQKISQKAKSRGIPISAIEAAKVANRGRKQPIEQRRKTSEALRGREFSQDHRLKIGEKSRGRVKAETELERISRTLKQTHFKAYTWVLKDPLGNIHTTNNIGEFCEQYDLAYSIFRYKAQVKNSDPITRGKSKGWCVLCVNKARNQRKLGP